MPIYAYRCSACGHAKDVLQKMSDPLLHTCPVCGAEAFTKQVTAAGFQLKGSGWYVTDFRGGNTPPPKADGTSADAAKPDAAKPDTVKPADAAAPAAASAPAADSKPAAPAKPAAPSSTGSA